jgi:hypothetical protein
MSDYSDIIRRFHQDCDIEQEKYCYLKTVSPGGLAYLESVVSLVHNEHPDIPKDTYTELFEFLDGYSKLASETNAVKDTELNKLFSMISKDVDYHVEDFYPACDSKKKEGKDVQCGTGYISRQTGDLIKKAMRSNRRGDKITAIDAIVHEEHERGSILPQILGLFTCDDELPESFKESQRKGKDISWHIGINYAVNKILEDLAK